MILFTEPSPVQTDMDRRERLRLLARAYMKEFGGNIKNNAKSLKAAEAWAQDYPDIWKEWKDTKYA